MSHVIKTAGSQVNKCINIKINNNYNSYWLFGAKKEACISWKPDVPIQVVFSPGAISTYMIKVRFTQNMLLKKFTYKFTINRAVEREKNRVEFK